MLIQPVEFLASQDLDFPKGLLRHEDAQEGTGERFHDRDIAKDSARERRCRCQMLDLLRGFERSSLQL